MLSSSKIRASFSAWTPLLLGAVLAALVCYPFAGGRLLLLDFVSGPRQPLLPATAFGLSGGQAEGVPLAIGFRLLDRLLGQAGSAVPAAVFFPLATTGAARLMRAAQMPARIGAGLIYAVNPFVFDRLYAGQLGLLLGYALLPFAVTALLDAAQEPHHVGRAACLAAATVTMSVHFAWILVPVTAAITLTRPRQAQALLRLGAAGLGAAAISSCLLVAPLLAGVSPSGALAQLTLYRTRADPRVGLLVNLAGLYGFFRPGPIEPKDLFSLWPALLAALLLIVAVGYAAALRDVVHRRDSLAILAAGVAGYFLALGDQGPTGGLFKLAYEHVPGFVIMREPDKFAVLLALTYAYGFGQGITWLTAGSQPRITWVASAALAVALPLTYTPSLFDGLGGQVKASEVPSSWSTAARLAGHQTVLFLPWHEYFPATFTGQRAIANPAAFYFTGTVLTSQNPGAGYAFSAEDPEHVFLDKLLGPPDLPRMRVALANLGVRFVALAKVADWRDFARVIAAPGIRLVYSSPSLELFSVAPTAMEIRDDSRVRSLDLADYKLLPGSPEVVALPVPYSKGWALAGHPAIRLADGQAGIFAPAAGGVVHYGPSGGVLASEIGSLAAALAVAAVAFFERRRRARAHQGTSDSVSSLTHGLRALVNHRIQRPFAASRHPRLASRRQRRHSGASGPRRESPRQQGAGHDTPRRAARAARDEVAPSADRKAGFCRAWGEPRLGSMTFARNQWYVAAYSAEVGRSLLGRTVCGEPIVLYRTTGGQVAALADRCVHRRFPLTESSLVGDTIVCGYHGFTYAPDGRCVAVPGQQRIPRTARVPRYEVAEQDSFVWVWIGAPDLADRALIPRAPWLADPAYVTVCGMEPLAARYGLLVDNLLDLSHETYLHGGYIGTAEVADTPITTKVDEDNNIVYVSRRMDDATCPPFYSRSTGITGRIVRWQDIEYHPPCLYLLHSRVAPAGVLPEPDGTDPGGFHVEVVYAITPSAANSTYDFWAVARDFARDDQEVSDFLAESNRTVVLQDVAALNLLEQVIAAEPADVPELSINIDTGGLAARRMLARLMAKGAARDAATCAGRPLPAAGLVP